MHVDCQMSISSELFYVLSWNSQRMLKGEDQLTKRQYVHTTTNTTTAAIFTSFTTISVASTTISIATTCKAKSIKMKISRGI